MKPVVRQWKATWRDTLILLKEFRIILLRHDRHSEMYPTDTRPLHAGDTLAALGGPKQLSRLMQANQQVKP